MDHPSTSKWTDSQLVNGEHPWQFPSAMVQHWGLNILPMLQSLSFELERSSDIAIVPDAVFERRVPKGGDHVGLLVHAPILDCSDDSVNCSDDFARPQLQ
jgi:hypothetical protein